MEQRPIDKRVEDALNSLEGVQRATVKPWFFTRVNARLQKDEGTFWASIGSFLAKPAVALAGVITILVLNGFLLLSNKDDNAPGMSAQMEQQLATENESVVASISSFDYENLVQP